MKALVEEIERRKAPPYFTPYTESLKLLSTPSNKLTVLKFQRFRAYVAEWEQKFPGTLKMETPAGSNQRGVSASPPQAVDHATSTSLPASRPSPQKAS